ncbi:MAG: hypothetical protein ABF709_09480 [Leuconostoc pseudomesenteroides]|uniref:hypothetical protein n=1 Tax=Leuconostoc pseudomesenteroides TaxID=33968 RepID=UPI00301DA601
MAEGFEKLSKIQDDILGAVWQTIGDTVDTYYIEGLASRSEDGSGMLSGRFAYGVKDGKLLKNTEVGVEDENIGQLNKFIIKKIHELYDTLIDLQGISPVRFRWVVDVKTGHIDSDWTYYDKLTPEELENNAWKGWRGDEMWETQIRKELAKKAD